MHHDYESNPGTTATLLRLNPAGVPLARQLARFGARPAVVQPDGTETSYDQLAARVADMALKLGTARRLIVVSAANELEPLVAYLAALATGNPVLLVPPDRSEHIDHLLSDYDPDLTFMRDQNGWRLEERHVTSAHALHADLAVLLSTSGSTGSPKLVRLSRDNVQSNAESIANYLDIRDTDRAAVTLPMHYCYGLSVINSNLLRGACVLLSNYSVVDTCFRDFFQANRGTSFAGVPHTFDLLERAGFGNWDMPNLRYVTQAGGRLAPEKVRRFAELGQRSGWDFFVMYGQTEATARMAYLPPQHVISNPSSIGVPIPGGQFDIVDANESGEGELFYTGPNVMLGYAQSPDDLALGRTVSALATGDIARKTPDGLYELVARKSRFIKICGLRIDLERVERRLADQGVTAACTGTDEHLVVGVTGDADTDTVRSATATHLGLPVNRVFTQSFLTLPRLSNGKLDYSAIAHAATPSPTVPIAATSIRNAFVSVFSAATVCDTDSFVSLGGDSLSYVEASFLIEQHLGYLPDGWHTMSVRELTQLEPRKGWITRIDTTVLLRAVAIFFIVSSHVRLIAISGGAHVLLAVAGWNFARFGLAREEQSRHRSRVATGITRIAVPTLAALTLQTVFSNEYDAASLLLVNNYMNFGVHSYWFAEALIQLLVVFGILLAIPPVRRWERRRPFAFAMSALCIALIPRVIPFATGGFYFFKTHLVAWMFLLGWAAQRATTTRQRLVLSAIAVLSAPGYFDVSRRGVILAAGMLALLWIRHVPVPRIATRPIATLASASLFIYLSHFMLFPPLREFFPPAVVVPMCLVAGIAVWAIWQRLPAALQAISSRVRPYRPRLPQLSHRQLEVPRP